MSDRKIGLSRKFIALAGLATAAVILVIVFGYNTFSKETGGGLAVTEYSKQGPPPAGKNKPTPEQALLQIPLKTSPSNLKGNLSKAVLNVQGVTCSSCIQEIKAALAEIQGIEEILVDISRGATHVYYDSKILKEPARLAQAVTSRGYPAALVKTYSPEDLKKEGALFEAKSQYYIASVGGWEIARSDLETQLAHARKRYSKIYGEDVFSSARGKALLDSLRAQITSRLMDEGVMLQEITKDGYRLNEGAVEAELRKVIEQSGKGPDDFREAVNESGMTFEYFKKRLETQLLISRYVDEKILSGASTDAEKQTLFTSWFNNAKILAEVAYYDKDLERLVQQQSAQGKCGG